MSPRRTSTDLALISGFAALIAVCALLPAIKVGANPVPITLQTFGVLLAGAVLGARLFHALAYLDVYGGQPSLLLDTSRGGFSLTGAVLGGAATGWYVASLLEDTARRWAGVAATPMLLALGIGKAGQFSAGGGQGAFWDGPWAVAFSGPGPWLSATPGVAAHPVALYEAIWYLAGVGLAVWGGRWLRGSGVVGEGAAFLVALCWFLAGRVVLGTFWRDDRLVGPLNAEQALAMLALGVIVVVMSSVRLRRRGRMQAAERAGLVPPVNREG